MGESKVMINSSISLRTPFIVKAFDNIELFIKTVFPDIEGFLHKEISSGISPLDLENKAYQELEKQFKKYIVQNYEEELYDYITKEASHTNKDAMKDVLLSTISITLNIRDTANHKVMKCDYLMSLRDLMKKIDR